MLFRRKYIAVLAMVLMTGWLTGCSSGDGISTPAQWFQTFKVTIENVATAYDYGASGVANTPVGAAGPGAIGPGDMYEFTFSATPGSKLSFASAEATIEATGMEIGGVTPFGLPDDVPLWVDGRVMLRDRIILGGGSRDRKLLAPPTILTALGAEIVEGLAREAS